MQEDEQYYATNNWGKEEYEVSKDWEEVFEDELCFDWETLEFKNHKTKFINNDGNYSDESVNIEYFLVKYLECNANYDDYPNQKNKVKIKARKDCIQIERVKDE